VGSTILEDLSLPDLIKCVVEEKSRPKLANNMDLSLAEIIKDCWKENPKERPTYSELLDRLVVLKFSA
jgi:Protein tyrosine and serine/threonine kinase